MAHIFKTVTEMNKFLDTACNKAVENACNRLLGKLQELIMSEYYDSYDPTKYQRTFQFYESAMTEMLSTTCGQIFMNPDKMNYPFTGRGWSWDGATQIYEANQGSHGGWSTDESRKHRYWDEFEAYAEKNALKILKQELKSQGLEIK